MDKPLKPPTKARPIEPSPKIEPPPRRGLMLPSRNHVVVLVSKLHKPTMRALAYARATRPDSLTALTVNVSVPQVMAS